MSGLGGCPMTGKEMLGNLATENLVRFLENKNENPKDLDRKAFNDASKLAGEIFF
jgi:hydroxymethylglutaryl-CoA lyase